MLSQQDDAMNIADQPFSSEFAVVDEVVRAAASEFAARGFVLMNATVEGSPRLLPFLVFHSRTTGRLGSRCIVFSGERWPQWRLQRDDNQPKNRKLVVLDYLERRGRSDLPRLFTYKRSSDGSA